MLLAVAIGIAWPAGAPALSSAGGASTSAAHSVNKRKQAEPKGGKASSCSSPASVNQSRCAGTLARKLQGMVASDGAVSRQVALETFAAEVATLPGVKVPRGQVGYVGDGTAAVYQLLAYWSQLSGVQRNAIMRVIVGLVTPARRRARIASAHAAALPGSSQASALAHQYVNAYERIFGKLNQHIYVSALPLAPDLDAGTFPLASNWLPFGTPTRCMIILNTFGPLSGGESVPASAEQVLAHEVFHCFQAQFAGKISHFAAALDHSEWLMEGGANYAACWAVPDPDDFVGPWVRKYYSSYAAPLFTRTYDAVGFFDHLGDAVGKTQQQTLLLMPAMVSDASMRNAGAANTASFLDAVHAGEEGTVLGSSAASLFADSSFPEFSEQDSCALASPPQSGVTPIALKLSTGSQQLTTRQLANGLYDLTQGNATDDDVKVLRVQVRHGYVRIAGGANHEDDLLGAESNLGSERTYCLQAGGCTCPDGSSSGAPTTDGALVLAGAPPPHLAITGDLNGGEATLTGYPLSCLSVKGLDPSLVCSKLAVGCVHGPPASSICPGVPSTWSQFEVAGTGLVPDQTYNLTLGGTAHGVTESKPIGPITADGSGRVSNQIFTLPYIPAHDPWTLTATPHDAGQVLTTTLETGEIDCVQLLAGGGVFRSLIAAVGLTPNSPFKEIVDGTTYSPVQADAGGTVPDTEIDGTCQPGLVQIQLSGYWLDHGVFTDDATDDVDQYC